MKKLAALLIALVLTLTLSMGAFAEEYTVDTSFEGVVFTYEDINMQIKIPSTWYRAELSEEAQAKGYFDCFAAEDGTFMLLSIVDNSIENIIEAVQNNETLQDPAVIYINDIEALTYVDVEFDCYGTIMPLGDGTRSVLVIMGPSEDENVAGLLMTLMATIDTIQ